MEFVHWLFASSLSLVSFHQCWSLLVLKGRKSSTPFVSGQTICHCPSLLFPVKRGQEWDVGSDNALHCLVVAFSAQCIQHCPPVTYYYTPSKILSLTNPYLWGWTNLVGSMPLEDLTHMEVVLLFCKIKSWHSILCGDNKGKSNNICVNSWYTTKYIIDSVSYEVYM